MRRYDMKERASHAAATRDRILRATFELHAAKGVLATSHKDVAKRAEVSVGTVYHHFPTADELVQACGAHAFERFPPPTTDAIDPAAPLAKRVEQLTLALTEFYLSMPSMERVRADRSSVPVLDAALRHFDDGLALLVRRALGSRAKRRNAVPFIVALLDASVVERLSKSGMKKVEIARSIASVINSWLKGEGS